MQRERVDFVQIHVLNLFRCKSELLQYFRNVMINYQYAIIYIHIALHFRTLDLSPQLAFFIKSYIQSDTIVLLHFINVPLLTQLCTVRSNLCQFPWKEKSVNPTLQNSNWILWRKKIKALFLYPVCIFNEIILH